MGMDACQICNGDGCACATCRMGRRSCRCSFIGKTHIRRFKASLCSCVKIPPRAGALQSYECHAMAFGKYKGMPLYHIALINPSYLEYVVSVAEDHRLRMHAQMMCDDFAVEIAQANERHDWRRQGW